VDDCTTMTGLTRVDTGPSWCNGGTPLRIDHLVIDGSSLRVVEVIHRYDGKSPIPSSDIPSDHGPIACRVVVCGTAPGGPPKEHIAGDTLSAEMRDAIAGQYEALLQKHQPPPVRGKPNAEQLALLKAFADAKKDFVQSFHENEDAQAFAKAVCNGKAKK
jgi:hypothetical protein